MLGISHHLACRSNLAKGGSTLQDFSNLHRLVDQTLRIRDVHMIIEGQGLKVRKGKYVCVSQDSCVSCEAVSDMQLPFLLCQQVIVNMSLFTIS